MVKSIQNLQASMHMGVQTKYIIWNAAGTRYTDSAKMRSSIGSQIELQYLLRRQDTQGGLFGTYINSKSSGDCLLPGACIALYMYN